MLDCPATSCTGTLSFYLHYKRNLHFFLHKYNIFMLKNVMYSTSSSFRSFFIWCEMCFLFLFFYGVVCLVVWMHVLYFLQQTAPHSSSFRCIINLTWLPHNWLCVIKGEKKSFIKFLLKFINVTDLFSNSKRINLWTPHSFFLTLTDMLLLYCHVHQSLT